MIRWDNKATAVITLAAMFLLTIGYYTKASAQIIQGVYPELAKDIQPVPLPELIYSLLPSQETESLNWSDTLGIPIVWVTNGIEYYEVGGIRTGLVRVRVDDKASTVLRNTTVELAWSVSLVTNSVVKVGPKYIQISPGLVGSEQCFGSIYGGCDFTVRQALATNKFSSAFVCHKYLSGGGRESVYRLSAPGKRTMLLLHTIDGGSGGVSANIELHFVGDAAGLCHNEESSESRIEGARVSKMSPDVVSADDVARGFYNALSHSDGDILLEYMIPEKRNIGSLNGIEITKIYSQLFPRLAVTDIQHISDNIVNVRYNYGIGGANVCHNTGKVSTKIVDNIRLIESVQSNKDECKKSGAGKVHEERTLSNVHPLLSDEINREVIQQSPPSEPVRVFSESDTQAIVENSRNNELRFDRDYKGRRLVARGSFKSVSKAILSELYEIVVKTVGGDIWCKTGDKKILANAINWSSGQQVITSGRISTTVMGSIILDDGCTVASQRE